MKFLIFSLLLSFLFFSANSSQTRHKLKSKVLETDKVQETDFLDLIRYQAATNKTKSECKNCLIL